MKKSTLGLAPLLATLISCGGGSGPPAPAPSNPTPPTSPTNPTTPPTNPTTPPTSPTAPVPSPITSVPTTMPVSTGGTVHSLVSNWTGTGFRLLTTAPPAPTYRAAPHAGSVWDDARQTMWIFGSETHGTDMDNAVYGWRSVDGLFVKNYEADPKTDYRMDANGVYWASAAKVRPWAMHTYRRMRWIPESSEFEVMYDPHEHAAVTPIFENPAHTVADRKPAVWYYNVATGKWRHTSFGQSASMVGTAFIFPMGWAPTYGWFTDEGAKWSRLTPEGVLSSVSVFRKSNTQYHSFIHVKNGIGYRVGGNANVILYSRHPLNDVAASTVYDVNSYAALNGFTVTNMASVMMPDGKIIIFPTKENEIHAMILDPVANTVTATGHVVPGMDKVGNYELAAEWSPANNAAILLSRRFSQNRVYGYRP